MIELNRMLTANPLEFAAIFEEVTGDAATPAGTDNTGLPPAGAELAKARSTRRQGPRDTHVSPGVSGVSVGGPIETGVHAVKFSWV
jgi:hypothetical protein